MNDSSIRRVTHQEISGYCKFEPLYQKVAQFFPDGSHFVEVGAWLGQSAVYMAEQLEKYKKPNTKFDCIDFWQLGEWSDDDHYKVIEELIGRKPNSTYDFEHLFKKHTEGWNQINPIKGNSWDVSRTYAPSSLDFVFIDGGHTYANVMHDIACWWNKVKIGGVLAGDDYNWAEVKMAVNDFSQILGLGKVITLRNSWIIPRNLQLSLWSEELEKLGFEE